MTDAKDDAVPGSSNAKDLNESEPSTSNANHLEDPVSGPSDAKDFGIPPSRKIKTVTFSQEVLSSAEEPRKRSMSKRRQSSIIGSAGYVSQLVEELQTDEYESPFQETESKPIRKQSIQEIKSSVKEVEADIGFYMKSVARMSISGRPPSIEKLPTISQGNFHFRKL